MTQLQESRWTCAIYLGVGHALRNHDDADREFDYTAGAEKALEQARQAIADYATDALVKPSAEAALAIAQAQCGDIDSAIAALPHLLEVPNGITVGNLRIDPVWDPLRKDPRFQKLVAEEPH